MPRAMDAGGDGPLRILHPGRVTEAGMIKIRFRLSVHDGWGSCEGSGETLGDAVNEAGRNGGVDLDQCGDIEVGSVSIGGREIVHDEVLEALAKYADFSDTASLVALVKDYQVVRDIQARAVPLLDAWR